MGFYYVPKVRKNVPACFPTPEIFGRWREMARSCGEQLKFDGYCADCTQRYHDEMVKVGLCAFPETTFSIDEDGFEHGYRKVTVFPFEAPRRVKIKETDLAEATG